MILCYCLPKRRRKKRVHRKTWPRPRDLEIYVVISRELLRISTGFFKLRVFLYIFFLLKTSIFEGLPAASPDAILRNSSAWPHQETIVLGRRKVLIIENLGVKLLKWYRYMLSKDRKYISIFLARKSFEYYYNHCPKGVWWW